MEEVTAEGLELGPGFWGRAQGVLRQKGLELQQLPPHSESALLARDTPSSAARRFLRRGHWPFGGGRILLRHTENGGVSIGRSPYSSS